MTITDEVWQYERLLDASTGFVGYDAEAIDGTVGKIDAASVDEGRNFVVVDMGIASIGNKRLVPAGMVRRVDHENERVHLATTRDQICAAPGLDETIAHTAGADYYDTVGRYYGEFGS
jgi:hypothetical protein